MGYGVRRQTEKATTQLPEKRRIGGQWRSWRGLKTERDNGYPRTRLPESQEHTRLSASLPGILLCREHFDSALVRGPIMQMNKMIRILDHPVRVDNEVSQNTSDVGHPLRADKSAVGAVNRPRRRARLYTDGR